MAALLDRFSRADSDAELISLNDKRCDLGCLPEDFFPLMEILKMPGEFCVSTTETGQQRVSIRDDLGAVHHLLVERAGRNKLRIKGILFGSGRTLGELLYNLREPCFDILSHILGAQVDFRRLIGPDDLRNKRLLTRRNVRKGGLVLTFIDGGFKHFSTEIETAAGRIIECEAVQATGTDVFEWRQRMFQEMRVALLAEQKKLPIYAPFAMLLEGDGYLVYKKKDIQQLDVFVRRRLHEMDIAARMKLMVGVVGVMAELHLNGIFHGALELQHFVVQTAKEKVQFNGGDGLAPISAQKMVTLANYETLAPEVTYSRRLTPLSGVYSLGKILKSLSEMTTDALGRDANVGQLRTVSVLISRCLSRRPGARPTMDGIFLRLREAHAACQQKKTAG